MKNSFSIDKHEFDGKRVLVTGGTKGMGKAIADRLTASGATVITTARSVPEEIASPDLFVQADVSTETGIEKIIAFVKKQLGSIDILINNVGGSSNGGPAIDISDEDWLHVFNTNLFAAVRLDKAFLPDMIAQKQGVIIHVTSVAGRRPWNTGLPYPTAKAALRMYSKGLSNEVAAQGIRVNALSPGFIETEGASGLMDKIAQMSGSDRDQARIMIMNSLGGIPLNRTGTAEEVAELAAFLASDRASYITGCEYNIDGGNTPTV